MDLNSVFLLVFGIVVGIGLCGLGFCQFFKKTDVQETVGEK